MQTRLADFIRDTPQGREADAILRKCVHCGFCTATCPTYQLLGDELDGPRGRIYLVKQVLEGAVPTERTRLHLDRCLTCRSCETTCPSGVQYARLLDIGRRIVEEKTRRGALDRLRRAALRAVLPRRDRFAPLLALGRALRPLLPAALGAKVPPRRDPGPRPAPRHARRMLALAGCVQSALAPQINAAAARVLDRVGISLIEPQNAGCCGALRFHLNDQDAGKRDMRALMDVWWPHLEEGHVEGVVVTASGCGAMIREYAHLFEHDAAYAQRAARVTLAARDLAEVVAAEASALDKLLAGAPRRGRVAFQSPCTLQHALGIRGTVERLLERAGYELAPVPEAHLCCGSAGAYSLLMPDIANALRRRKLAALESGSPEAIATANIGCLVHLQAGTHLPVRHWIELLDEALAEIPRR
jgi:glycolate oxidase iron-sulfur subunit